MDQTGIVAKKKGKTKIKLENDDNRNVESKEKIKQQRKNRKTIKICKYSKAS